LSCAEFCLQNHQQQTLAKQQKQTIISRQPCREQNVKQIDLDVYFHPSTNQLLSISHTKKRKQTTKLQLTLTPNSHSNKGLSFVPTITNTACISQINPINILESMRRAVGAIGKPIFSFSK
jgi:hypothetical protein